MTRRMERVNVVLRQEISRVLANELRDPRLTSLVSVTRVEATDAGPVHDGGHPAHAQPPQRAAGLRADASDGVQLDLLHDPDGVGKYRMRSPALLATAKSAGPFPVVSDTASLIYQWQKRSVKRQESRQRELEKWAINMDTHLLLDLSLTITGSTDTAHSMLGQVSTLTTRPRNTHLGKQMARLAQRLAKPVGFWGHVAEPTVGVELALRFSRFLVTAETQPTPSPKWQPVWWATSIMPVRLRPGIFLSTGRSPRWPTPDVVVSASSIDESAHQLTSAMTARVG